MSKQQAKKKKKTKKKKTNYKVKNWSEYNESLVSRGSLTIWITPEVMANWKDQRPAQRGGQYEYSDVAIECLLTLRYLFKLPLRAVQGFSQSLFELLDLELPIPDYSTLSRRSKKLEIRQPQQKEPLRHIVMDSTGLKVFGEGEWKVRKHGYSKRRTWRKLHLSINPETQEIVLAKLTSNSITDAQAGVEMLKEFETPPEKISGDGGYDQHKIYEACQELEIKDVTIPPQRNAKIWHHGNCKAPPHPRDENLRYIRRHGRAKWKRDHHYHQRSLAETSMFRFKVTFGPDLRSRTFEAQGTEAMLKCKILNRFTLLGLPDSYVVVKS